MSCLKKSSNRPKSKENSTGNAVAATNMTDSNASFLRAAKDGNLPTILDCLKSNIDINTSNANGLNALHLAAKEGHVEIVTELLKRGANVNAATKKGNTALHIASLAGQEDVVKVLVSLGANVNVQSQNGFTPLYMAAQENHDNVVSFLLANGANQSLATEDGFTPLAVALQQGHDKVVAVLLENDTKGRVRLPALHIAAKKDDCKAATLLLQSDYNPDVTSKSGFTPLHIAAHYGNERIANILLDRGADVNYTAKHHITPLHVASKWGKANMVNLLMEKGATVDPVTRDGLTPLHCAARSGHDQVVDLLLERDAPILAKTKNGLAPLHMASQGDHVDSARILLCNKAPVDDVTVDYLTALHVAAHCGHVKVAKLLLDRKADPNARALNGFTPLHIACKKNRMKVVELLLKNGASIEATTESGLSPLHVASFMGCMNIVIHLIQSGANPDLPTVRGETPLHLAARANQIDIIRILLRNGANVDARAREDQTPLHIAARLGNVDIVSLLLQHGAAVDATTKDLYTALHIAAKEGQEEVATVLIDHNASLIASTKRGFTPLHLAAKYGNINVMKLLLHKDAPVDAQGKNGLTPLHVAAHYNHVNEALLTLEKGASPHAAAKNGYTPLHIAAKKNQMDIVTALLEYGAKCSAESKAGYTPLHLSSQEGHAEMSTLLIEHQADVNCKANNGLTPLHLCAQEDRVDVASVLVKNGAKLHSQTNAGYSPLHIASHFGHINMVRFLLQNNADVHAITEHGYTPLHQASQQGHVSVVNLLLEHNASPNTATLMGHAPLSIAQRLGYISVVEALKTVTETAVTTSKNIEEKYEVVSPEMMQETFLTDSEDEGGEDVMLGDQSYRYLTADEMKSLGDDSLPIDVTRDEKQHEALQVSKTTAAPMVEEDKLSPQHIISNEVGFSEKFSPDNIDISHVPIHAGFLVSFMVDARGGAMRGCRHSGVRIIIPPRKASMPMRITCRYLRKEKLIHPPPLMEGEACASRILEMGPVGARFLGPVIIEVPHFASLRGKEREITILRSDTGESWREHTLEASEEAVQDVLNESFEGDEFSALEDLNTTRITRILTTDFPQYFAIITRIRQEVHTVGPEGGKVASTVVPQVQAIFPDGALQKKIKVCLQAHPIAPELVTRLLGNRVAVSPIVTLEPRRRKFHKEITLTIPVPQAASKGMINQYNSDAPTLRLLCSITGSTKSGSSKAQWEDVTGSTSLTIINECVSFTTTVSARFWLMDCRQLNEATRFATELYQEAIHVPFMAKFVVFAKRNDTNEAQMRVFCMSDDKEDKTLETQEHFTEIAKSRDVEVLEDKLQYLEFAGNLLPVTNSGEQLKLTFQAFHENRLPFNIRMKDQHGEPVGRVAFMREPKVGRGEVPQIPVCNLNISLPEISESSFKQDHLGIITVERSDEDQGSRSELPQEPYHVDLLLSDIARELDKDWVILARELGVSQTDISSAKARHPENISEQALSMLHLWCKKFGSRAAGKELEKGLVKINRIDIIKECANVEETTKDEAELRAEEVHDEAVSEQQIEFLATDISEQLSDDDLLNKEKNIDKKETILKKPNTEMKTKIIRDEESKISDVLEKSLQLDTRLILRNVISNEDEQLSFPTNLCESAVLEEMRNKNDNLSSEDNKIQNFNGENRIVDNTKLKNIVSKECVDALPTRKHEHNGGLESQTDTFDESSTFIDIKTVEVKKYPDSNRKIFTENNFTSELFHEFHSNENASENEKILIVPSDTNDPTLLFSEENLTVLNEKKCEPEGSITSIEPICKDIESENATTVSCKETIYPHGHLTGNYSVEMVNEEHNVSKTLPDEAARTESEKKVCGKDENNDMFTVSIHNLRSICEENICCSQEEGLQSNQDFDKSIVCRTNTNELESIFPEIKTSNVKSVEDILEHHNDEKEFIHCSSSENYNSVQTRATDAQELIADDMKKLIENPNNDYLSTMGTENSSETEDHDVPDTPPPSPAGLTRNGDSQFDAYPSENIRMKSTPESIKMKFLPESIEIKSTPESIEIKSTPESIEMKSTPESIEMKSTPESIEMKSTPESIEMKSTSAYDLDTTHEIISVMATEDSLPVSILKDDSERILKIESTNIISEDTYAACKTRSNEKLDGATADHLEKEPDVQPVDEMNERVSFENTDPEESLILVSEATMISDQRISELPIESKNAGFQNKLVAILKHSNNEAETEEWTEMDESGAMKHHIQKTTHMTLSMQQKSDEICDDEDVTLPLKSDAATEVGQSTMIKAQVDSTANDKSSKNDAVCTQDAFYKSKVSESPVGSLKDVNSSDIFCYDSHALKKENMHDHDENPKSEQQPKSSNEPLLNKQLTETVIGSEPKDDVSKEQMQEFIKTSTFDKSLTQLEDRSSNSANGFTSSISQSAILKETDIPSEKVSSDQILSGFESKTTIDFDITQHLEPAFSMSSSVEFQETEKTQSEALEFDVKTVSVDEARKPETSPGNKTDFYNPTTNCKNIVSTALASEATEKHGLVKDSTFSEETSYGSFSDKVDDKRCNERHVNSKDFLHLEQYSKPSNQKNDESESLVLSFPEKTTIVKNIACEAKSTALAFDNSAFVGADLIDACEQTTHPRSRSPYEVLRNDNDFDFSFSSKEIKNEAGSTTREQNMCAVRQRTFHRIPSKATEEELISDINSKVRSILQKDMPESNIDDKKDAIESIFGGTQHITRCADIQPKQFNQDYPNDSNDNSNTKEHKKFDKTGKKTDLDLLKQLYGNEFHKDDLESKNIRVIEQPIFPTSTPETNDNVSGGESESTNYTEKGAFSKVSKSLVRYSSDEQYHYKEKSDCIEPTDEDFEIIEESEIASLAPDTGLRKMGSYKDITTLHLGFETSMQDTSDQFTSYLSDREVCEDNSAFIYGMQFERDIEDQSEEAMDVDSDQFSEEKELNYAYGMRFEREHELEGDDDDIPGYGDLYTHQEEDEETADEVEKAKISERRTDFDILAGRKCFAKNGELDDVSVSSLQEFERLEEEIRSGRRLSIGSLDSFNGKQHISKSGEHDDVSMNSLTEFEKLETECLETEKTDACVKDTTRLSEIEEGQESLTSETSQETSSDLGRGEFDNLQVKFNEMSENSIENENENKLEPDIKLSRFQERTVRHISLTSLEQNDCYTRIDLHHDTEIGPSKDKLLPDTINLSKSSDRQREIKEVNFCSVLPNVKVKNEMMEQLNLEIESSSDIPCSKIKAKCKETCETMFQTSRIDDLDQDSLHEEKSIKPDSLSDEEYDVYRDSLREDRSENVDSLQDEIHDSLHEKEPEDQDSLHEMDIFPDESSLSLESSFTAVVDVFRDSLSKKDYVYPNVPESDFDTDSLREVKACTSLDSGTISHFCEITDVGGKSNFDKMVSSSDSLECSSSSMMHAAYQFESESLSCSFNSAQTPEDCKMISSTDVSEPETLSCTFGNSTNNICAIPEESSQSDSLDAEGNFSTDNADTFVDKKKKDAYCTHYALDSQILKKKSSLGFETDISMKGSEMCVEFLPPNNGSFVVTNQCTTTSSQSSRIIKPSILTEKFEKNVDNSLTEDPNFQIEKKLKNELSQVTEVTSDNDIGEFNGSSKVPSDV